MSETKTLDVTAEDIAQGSHSAVRCPFALAAMRLLGQDHGVSVVGFSGSTPANILVQGNGPGNGYWDIDKRGGAVIAAYDSDGHMEPGQYVITRREAA